MDCTWDHTRSLCTTHDCTDRADVCAAALQAERDFYKTELADTRKRLGEMELVWEQDGRNAERKIKELEAQSEKYRQDWYRTVEALEQSETWGDELQARLVAVHKLLDWQFDSDAASDDRIFERGYQHALNALRAIFQPPTGESYSGEVR